MPPNSNQAATEASNAVADASQDQPYQPVRQPSQRRIASESQTHQDQVHQRMVEEMTAFVTENVCWIVLFVFCLTALFVTMFVLFILALIASVHAIFYGPSCDQPLMYYVIVVILWGQLPGKLTECVAQRCEIYDGDVRKALLSLLFALPSWFLLGWGLYMVRNTQTCEKKNPNLYFAMEHYIYGQVVLLSVLLLIGIAGAFGFRRFLLWAQRFIVRPGCEKAVRKLPKVEPGSRELIDEEDGEIKGCTICFGAMGGEPDLQRTSSGIGAKASEAIVRTPCSHYFHEECLAEWCKNHTDCPLCREPVGEPDPAEPETGEEMTEP